MEWNKNFTLSDFLMDPKMKGVFPQFGRTQPAQVYSFAEQTRQVKAHLRGLLRATAAPNGDLRVKGNQQEVLNRVQAAQVAIEQLFNAMPTISSNIRSGSKLYMPYATRAQIQELTEFDDKVKAIQSVVDNIKYNPDFKSKYTTTRDNTDPNFKKEQAAWQKRVGYKEGEIIWQ